MPLRRTAPEVELPLSLLENVLGHITSPGLLISENGDVFLDLNCIKFLDIAQQELSSLNMLLRHKYPIWQDRDPSLPAQPSSGEFFGLDEDLYWTTHEELKSQSGQTTASSPAFQIIESHPQVLTSGDISAINNTDLHAPEHSPLTEGLPQVADSERLVIQALTKGAEERHRSRADILGTISATQQEIRRLHDTLDRRVALARHAGIPWREIGEAAGITAGAAHRRWDPEAKRKHAEYQKQRGRMD